LPSVSASLEQYFHGERVTIARSIHKRSIAILSHKEADEEEGEEEEEA
jgi:hypothetical protein